MHDQRSLEPVARLVALCAAVLTFAACDVMVGTMNNHAQATDTWSRSFPISADGRLEVVNVNGQIEVIAGSSGQVEIRAERIARANTDEAAKELLGKLEIKTEADAARVRVETVRIPGTGLGHRPEVRYFIKVPPTVSVRLENKNGQIVVAGIQGDVKAETTNGGVRGRDLSGAVEAGSTNGGVTLEVDALAKGGIRAETTNGGVELTLPENAAADIEATCVNGSVVVRGLTVDGESSRKRVSGRVNGGGPRVTLETTNGGVRINAGPAAK